MQLLDIHSETRRRHEVQIELGNVQPMMTPEKVYFSPSRLTIIYERLTGSPVALTEVTIEGPILGARSTVPPVKLSYRAAMHGLDSKRWATRRTWRTRYQRLPVWVQRLVAENWPGADII
jgi:hypothetical protein